MQRPASALVLLGLLGCGLPADVSDEFAVSMSEGVLVMTLGDTVGLGAVVTRNDQPAPEIEVVYSSSDPTVAGVTEQGLVRGIRVGQTEVFARALGIETETEASRTVRVLRAVAIESARPMDTESSDGRTVRWGELVEMVGVGLDPTALSVIFVDDVPAPVHSFVAAPAEDETASDTLRIWIPAGVPARSTILLSRRGGSTAAWPVNVIQEDVLEPNDLTRRTLELPAGGLDFRGLALEVRPWLPGQDRCHSAFTGFDTEPDTCWADGFTLRTGGGDATVVVAFPEGSVRTLPVSLEIGDDGSTDENWTRAQTFSLCVDASGSGFAFTVADHVFDSDPDSLILPLRGVEGDLWLDLTLFGFETSILEATPSAAPETAPWDLRVLPGYRTDLPPDEGEGNDHCHGAAPLPYPAGVVDLTFDHGRDLDWFSFAIPGVRPDLTPTSPTPESEPNDDFASADSMGYGERASGVIGAGTDADYYVFQATAGDWIDIEVRAERNENSSLNSLLQLYRGGELIAFNDDFSITTFDSRITVQAPETGTYVFSVKDLDGDGGATATYDVDLRSLGAESSRVTLSAEALAGATGIDFRPFIQIYQDDRANDGEIQLLAEFADTATTILTPGDYLVLAYNRAGEPAGYRLTVNGVPLG